MRIVRVDEVAPTSWKNGGGVTRELLRVPESGEWKLRISLADIRADGPFSAFDGIARCFAVIEGPGVRLRWPARELIMDSGAEPLYFDGADAPDCTLLDGPTRDLNIMTRRGEAAAMLVPAWFGRPCGWAAGPRGVFSLRPLVLLTVPGGAIDLPARTLCWDEEVDTSTWSLSPSTDAAADNAQTGSVPPAYWIIAKLTGEDIPTP